jgi:hypothetical protein
MQPSGPEPAAVYWIRRAAVLLIVVTVILGGWWLVSALRGGSSTTTDAAATDAASPSASAEATDGATDTGTDTTTDTATDAATSGEPVACRDSDISVEATTDASTYTVGSTPKLTLTITNIGTVACTRDVGPKANELEITSGGYHVWSSDDCNASTKSKVSTLEPGAAVASSITWDGRLSQKGCPDPEGAKAKPGRYDVIGRNGKVDSDPTPFALSSAE